MKSTVESFAPRPAMLTRRDVFTVPAAALAGAGRVSPDGPLADEGRRLVREYYDAYGGWRATSDATVRASKVAAATLPKREAWEVTRAWDDRSDAACHAAGVAADALTAFVARTGRAAEPPPDPDCIDLDLWPAAAVLLDGVLWVVHLDPDRDDGERVLTHVVMSNVAVL